MTLHRMKSCFWKLELGFWTYCLICILGSSGPNVVSRPETPRSRICLAFHKFFAINLWFLTKWKFCLWKLKLGFWTDGLIKLSGPKPKKFFDLIVWFDSSYASGQNEVLILKIGSRVLDLWLDASFGPTLPKYSF